MSEIEIEATYQTPVHHIRYPMHDMEAKMLAEKLEIFVQHPVLIGTAKDPILWLIQQNNELHEKLDQLIGDGGDCEGERATCKRDLENANDERTVLEDKLAVAREFIGDLQHRDSPDGQRKILSDDELNDVLEGIQQ